MATDTHNQNRAILMLAALVASSVLMGGCAASDDAYFGPNSNNGSSEREPVVAAENRLFEHDIVGANRIYTEELRNDPTNGAIAVGKAVTDFLLVPYSPEMNAILTDNLGAVREISASDDFIYRTEGLLDLLSRGVSFEDDGVLSGIETLLEDELPWARGRLGSRTEFVDGLERPVNGLMDNLVSLADSLEPIYESLDIALRDSSFGAFYVPGTVFFDDQLSLELGRAEVAFLRAGIAGIRGGIYFAAAYDWSWSLNEAFGDRWNEVAANPQDPDHVEGYDYDDYVTNFLGDRLGRTIRDAARLGDARDSARQMLANVRGGLEFGITRLETNEPDRALTFSDADIDEARDIVDFFQAVENALFGPTLIPFTEPDTTMDLSSFFEDGRTLPAEEVWFEQVTTTDEFGETTTWELRDRAFDLYFVEGVFSPEFRQGAEPTLEFGDGGETTFFDDVAGDLSRDVESTYGTR